MTVKKKPEVFETSDGKEWPTEDLATRHQNLLDATDALMRAQREFVLATAESMTTADGVLFDFQHWGYFVIRCFHGHAPTVMRVYVDRWSVDLDECGRARVYSATDRTPRHSPSETPRWLVTELYANEAKARADCIVKIREWVAERTEQMEREIAALGGDREP